MDDLLPFFCVGSVGVVPWRFGSRTLAVFLGFVLRLLLGVVLPTLRCLGFLVGLGVC